MEFTTTKEDSVEIKTGDMVRIENDKSFRRVDSVTTNPAGIWVRLENPRDGWMPFVQVKSEHIAEVR